MDTKLESVWKNVLSLLKDELTGISFNTWIKTIEPISMDNSRIKLGVPWNLIKASLKADTVI